MNNPKRRLYITSLVMMTACVVALLQFSNQKSQPIPIADSSENPVYRENQKIPKYDRPDLAVNQNRDMTRDPATGLIPVNRTLEAFKTIQSNASRAPISGVNWAERGPDNVGGRTRAIMFDPNDGSGSKVWSGGVAGGLWFNNDITSSSSTWQNVDDFWANLAISTVAYDPSSIQTFYVGTGEGFFNVDAVRGAGIWKSTDAGTSWSQLSSTDNSNFYYVQKLVVTPSGTVIAATREGLFRSTNGGSSWTQLFSGRFADVEVASNGDVYASEGIFSTGIVRKSTTDGVSWSTVTPTTGGERIELAIAPSNSNTIYAVASNNTDIAWFRKSTNGGSSWTTVSIPSYTSQSCTTSSDDFARGQAWYDLTLAVHPTNPDIAIVGGIDLYKTTNGGSSWGLISYWTGSCDTYVHADQHAIQFSPVNSNAAIFGNDGGVYYSSNVGSASNPSISARNNGYNVTQFYAADQANSSGSNYMLAGAQDNGSHQYTSSGINSTTEVTGGDGAYCHIDQANSNYQVTSYVYNSYYRSTNGGSSFSSILSNQTYGRFINPTDYDDNAKVLYCGANEDQYIRLTNMTGSVGAFLNTVSLGGFRVSALKASPYTSNRLFLGTGTYGSAGGSKVFRVDNAEGASPTVTEIGTTALPGNGYISSIEVGSSDNQIIITYSNYGVTSVWETRNGGSSWSNREGNLPDIPIRWALYNPANTDEVLLATELGVWSTDNVNTSSPVWGVTNTGLANVRCDMLQYRDSDGTVLVATHGRGVYTADPFSGGGSDTEAPTTPTSLASSSITTSSFDVSWTASTDNVGVTGYNVYLNGSLDGTTVSTSYSFSGLSVGTTYTVAVEAEDAAGNTSAQASINVTTSGGSSCTATVSSFPYSQSFESGIGDWTQDTGDDLNWTRDSGGTPSSGTGPSSGSDGSWYLYIEASGSGTGYPTMNAIITLPCMDVTGLSSPELNFSYHMNGTSMGDLIVQTSTNNGGSWSNAWSISGSQGNSWNAVSVALPQVDGLQIRFNGTTGSSWSSDIAIDDVSVEDGDVTPPTCPPITISTVNSYGGTQDAAGDFAVQDGGSTLFMENNTWKYISFPYTVTTNTVIDFEFRSTSEGEIHGIGFDSDNSISSNLTFKVHGIQNWGITNYDNYSGSDWVAYSIPVGSFYTGSFDRMFFTNDNDAGSGNNSYFRNIVVREGPCGAVAAVAQTNASKITPKLGTEPEFDFALYPNPASRTLHFNHNVEQGVFSVISVSGRIIKSGDFDIDLKQLDISDIPVGIYLLKVESPNGTITRKFKKM